MIAFDPYETNRLTGSFIVIDHLSDQTIGVGMIAFGLRRGANVHWQPMLVGKPQRAAIKHQKPAVLWFTGLSGAGKSTIANIVEERLHAAGHHTTLLDGDNVRHGLCRDLGFTEADRVENIRRAGEVAKLMTDRGSSCSARSFHRIVRIVRWCVNLSAATSLLKFSSIPHSKSACVGPQRALRQGQSRPDQKFHRLRHPMNNP